jgi:hypothetical protein
MSSSTPREPFIPVSVESLIEILCSDLGPDGVSPLPPEDQQHFRKFAEIASRHIHDRYLNKLKKLKASYAPFDPDCDLIPLQPRSEIECAVQRDELFNAFAVIMEKANFQRLTREQLEEAMKGASLWGVDMNIAWEAFDRMDVYVRGHAMGKRTIRKWYYLFRTREVQVPIFTRVAIVLKQRPHPALGPEADTRSIFLKLFKDIPRMDIEMLLPGTSLRMPFFDRLKLGGSGVSSLGYVGWKLSSMSFGGVASILSGNLLGLMALYTPLALIFGYGYRTYANFHKTRQSYMLQLSQSLYYQNLDNNAGVFFRLLDAAEEQETHEVLLGYFYLWRYAGQRGWTEEELDQYVELDLERRLNVHCDFEVTDSLTKLTSGGVIECKDGRYRALPIDQALERLEHLWDHDPDPFARHLTSQSVV